ncbi:MAG: 30S ribosome-binding factor RbfA [Gemmatimonadetes bacterium]|nr:30S ribosome-binding factor RbfA [Gemmatimonadota bacterium]
MSGRRLDRLNEQFKRELMHLIQRDVKDPRVTSVTITGVRVASDLGHARVYITSLVPDQEREALLAGLRAASPFLRGQLGRILRIGRAPELAFVWDETLERAQRIERLIADVRSEEDSREPGGEGEDDGL